MVNKTVIREKRRCAERVARCLLPPRCLHHLLWPHNRGRCLETTRASIEAEGNWGHGRKGKERSYEEVMSMAHQWHRAFFSSDCHEVQCWGTQPVGEQEQRHGSCLTSCCWSSALGMWTQVARSKREQNSSPWNTEVVIKKGNLNHWIGYSWIICGILE